MAFGFLLALTAILFARPVDILPVLLPLHPYELTIISCMILGFDRLVDTISTQSLKNDPILLSIVVLFCWTVLIEIVHLRLDPAYEAFDVVAKVFIYVVLLIGLVDRPSQLRLIFAVVVASGVINISCAILNYFDIINFEYMKVTEEVSYIDDEEHYVRRLGSSMIFGDPNDLSLFVNQCIIICAFFIWDGNGIILFRSLWLLPAGFLLYALTLTQSRGGFASLMAGIIAMIVSRLGRKSVLIIAPAVPIVLAFFAGRQASIDLGSGSGQARVVLWSRYYNLLWTHPLMGSGWDQGPIWCSQVAHNSYLQFYGEQGFLAGTLFVGITMLAIWALTRPVSDREWGRLRPCLLGLVVSQVVGMMSLTRNLAVPTFTVIGMAAVYLRSAGVAPLMPRGGKIIQLMIISSICYLIFMWFILKTNGQA